MTEPKDPRPKGKVSAGPFAHDEIAVRQRSLELAIDMVRTAKQFSNFQVIHTANSFAAFILKGATPAQPEAASVPTPEALAEALEAAKKVMADRKKAAPEKFEPKPSPGFSGEN